MRILMKEKKEIYGLERGINLDAISIPPGCGHKVDTKEFVKGGLT